MFKLLLKKGHKSIFYKQFLNFHRSLSLQVVFSTLLVAFFEGSYVTFACYGRFLHFGLWIEMFLSTNLRTNKYSLDKL